MSWQGGHYKLHLNCILKISCLKIRFRARFIDKHKNFLYTCRKGENGMIKKLTNHILSYLISSNAIDDNEETKDYYRYGIEITISSLINILLIIIIGIVSGNALESIVFLACFIPLRQFTGGFHAKTYFLCNLSFAVSFIILLIVYKFTNQYVTSYIVFLIIIFSCIIFFCLCQ